MTSSEIILKSGLEFVNEEHGASIYEYALIASIFAVVIVLFLVAWNKTD